MGVILVGILEASPFVKRTYVCADFLWTAPHLASMFIALIDGRSNFIKKLGLETIWIGL